MRKYGIKMTQSRIAHTKTDVIKITKSLGTPIVMKLVSKKLVHKSDIGAVITSIHSESEAIDALNKLQRVSIKHNVRFEGALMQKQLQGNEVIIGAKRDPQFGPTVLFGLGGIFVEIIKDYSLRVAPVSTTESIDMIKEIKGLPILMGARGKAKSNLWDIADTITKISKLMQKEKHVQEIDLNPCFSGDNCVAADVRVMVKQ